MRRRATQVGPLERLLYIKTLPGVGDLPGEALAALAQHAEEQLHRPGEVIIPADRPVDAVHFVVSGAAWTYFRGAPALRIEPPGGVGFLGLLSGQPEGVSAVAEGRTETLRVSADAVLEITEQQPDFALTGMREMSIQLLELRGGLPSNEKHVPRPDPASYPEGPVGFVQRLAALADSPVFTDANLDALAGLAERVVETRFEAGEELWKAGTPSDSGLTMLWGVVRCTTPDGEEWCEVGAPFGLGYLDAMSSMPRSYSARAETPVVALRGNIETYIDTLVEESSLLNEMLAWLAQALLSGHALRAQTQGGSAFRPQPDE